MSSNTHSVHHMSSEALGQSEAFLDFQEALSRVAPINRPVLILGERGTGKELAATRLHYLSRRWQGPFITLNCASLSPTLVEAELFGHEKGAFTGAHQQRKGRFQAADKGTLFLDEIANIPMEAQEKILRVVEYGTFEPVGSATSIEVDVRIISATNADLSKMAGEEKFMIDLLDRLSFEVLFLPPLRHRNGDILLLANHFARRMAMELGREDFPHFTPEAEHALEHHPWRGNVRELKNVVERAVYKSNDHLIGDIVFNPFVSPYGENHDSGQDGSFEPIKRKNAEKQEERNFQIKESAQASTLDTCELNNQDEIQNNKNLDDSHCETMEECDIEKLWDLPLKQAVKTLEITMVKRALAASRYHQKEAARYLGLTYDQFRGMMRKYKDQL